MSIIEDYYKSMVSELPCACCGQLGVHLHHIRAFSGMSQRAPDMLVIPLCPGCHTGPNGIHGDKTMMRIMKKTEGDMLADTVRKVVDRLLG